MLKGKSDIENGMRYIEGVLEEVQQNRCTLVTSALTYAEVLESTMPAVAKGKFDEFMTDVEVMETIVVSVNIAKKAQHLRETLRTNKVIKLATPDAVQVATAIVSNADFLHTFDNGLLKLNGKKEVGGLVIAKQIPPSAT